MMRPAGIRSHDEAARHRARRLLSRSNSGFHRLGDRFAALQRWLTGERWVKRLAVVIAVLAVIFAGCFGGLWWRLGAGPINLDVATPWLAAAIEDNIGHGNTVEVGGTQIERAGRIRIAVRIRDIVVRDRDHAIVATAPKAEVKLSGTALLMGRLRAESLNLVDAELAVRITPDGQVTVSAGDTAKPLATGVASKRDARHCRRHSRARRRRPRQARRGDGRPTPTQNGLLAGLDWLDSLSLTGLDGQNLNEIGLKNGNLIVDDQQRGNKWTFENISLSMRRPSGGGVAVRALARRARDPWSLRVVVGPHAERRAVGRSSRRQGAGRQHPAGDAGEGSHLQRGPAALRRAEGRTRPRRPADLFPRQGHARAPGISSTAIRPIIRWRSIRRK